MRILNREERKALIDDHYKATRFSLVIYELNTDLRRRGEELAREIDVHGDSCLKDMADVCIGNFVQDFNAILGLMEFFEDLAKQLGLDLDNDVPEGLRRLTTVDEVCDWFAGDNFNWAERRFYTKDEMEIRNNKRNEMALKIIKGLKASGKISGADIDG